ncbi:hypothetical protein EYF80_001465 [Liparis tanakae]|uniref:Uncharacterized protein n=1 Tax=Liparis tanakae TaxID=230148 RepID=A0A4Z2JDE6_9TELE|nr:hypothetical protein EYF80_001465 [Liparis tanakae]
MCIQLQRDGRDPSVRKPSRETGSGRASALRDAHTEYPEKMRGFGESATGCCSDVFGEKCRSNKREI